MMGLVYCPKCKGALCYKHTCIACTGQMHSGEGAIDIRCVPVVRGTHDTAAPQVFAQCDGGGVIADESVRGRVDLVIHAGGLAYPAEERPFGPRGSSAPDIMTPRRPEKLNERGAREHHRLMLQGQLHSRHFSVTESMPEGTVPSQPPPLMRSWDVYRRPMPAPADPAGGHGSTTTGDDAGAYLIPGDIRSEQRAVWLEFLATRVVPTMVLPASTGDPLPPPIVVVPAPRPSSAIPH